MSAGIGIREFARRDGCDDALVRRAIKSGKLTAFDDGTLDPAQVGTGWRKGNRNADKGADKSAPAAADVPAPEDATDEFLDDFIAKLLSGSFATLSDAERVKENALALKHLLDARRKAGELVDVETAKGVVFEAARSARDAWLNFPSRVGPLMAADLGVEPEPLIEALTAHVHQQLADLGEPELSFAADGEGTA